MHDEIDPPRPATDGRGRYRTIDFSDGLLIFDRRATAGWLHADTSHDLAEMR
jgi:hypothetical protein